MGWSIIRN